MGTEGLAQSNTVDALDETALSPFSPEEYNHLLFIHNEWSTRAAGTAAIIEQLTSSGIAQRLEIQIETTNRVLSDNARILADSANERTLIAVRAGDGGVSAILNAIRATGTENPVLVMAGGHKNDFVHQLFDPYYIDHPEAALAASSICSVRPIRVLVEPDEGDPISLDAFCYASVGVTGTVSKRVNDPVFKKSRVRQLPGGTYLAEHAAIFNALLRAPSFTISHDKDSQPREAIELLAANGNRMGGELRPDANLLVPGFRLVEVTGKLGGLSVLAAFKSGRSVGKFIQEGNVRFRVVGDERTILEVDGEYKAIGCAVIQLSTAPSGVNVLTSLASQRKLRS